MSRMKEQSVTEQRVCVDDAPFILVVVIWDGYRKGGEEDGKGRLTRNRRKGQAEKRPKKFCTKAKAKHGNP